MKLGWNHIPDAKKMVYPRRYIFLEKFHMTETIDFPMKPRLPCNHPELTLQQVKGEPMIFKFTCPECESRVKIIEGAMELVEDSNNTRKSDGLQSRGEGKE